MNQTILYLECSSGISGDMSVAALLDLGADRQVLTKALASLPLSGYSVEIKDVLKSGIRACDFNVILEKDNHDHDMQYLHGAAHTPIREAPQMPDAAVREKSLLSDPAKEQHSEHGHCIHHHDDSGHARHSECDHTIHHHNARNFSDIVKIIQAGALTDAASRLAIRIFRIIAEAEAQVHGKNIEEVHFHEVGAVDSIIDIVAFAVCLDNLHPDRVVVSALTDGIGQIRCQHGLIPVPVPAVTAIVSSHRLSMKLSSVEGELVTPTGAAIAAALQSRERLPTEFRILKTGFGAGKRDYATAGFLRAMLVIPAGTETQDTVLTLETNIDDSTGEALAFTLEQLMAAGALDAFFIPVFMKKNRPAQLLKVICQAQDRQTMEKIIFKNTTTIGIRFQELQRTKLERRILAVETPWGMADVKCCTYEENTYYYPENDSVYHLALHSGYGFSEMYGMIQAYTREHFSG